MARGYSGFLGFCSKKSITNAVEFCTAPQVIFDAA